MGKKKPDFLEKIIVGLVLLAAVLFFSYKLTRVPPGINIDEASMGYNATLIDKTLRDENGRFLPVFFLTIDGKDWKMPVDTYAAALLFKIFGASFFGLRFVNVVWSVLSAFLFYLLLRFFFGWFYCLLGIVLFITTPLIFIHSRVMFECLALLPFFLGWIVLLLNYKKTGRLINLFLSGAVLGASFYSYKSMHAMAPVYFALTILYLFFNFPRKDLLRRVLAFSIGAFIFWAPVPWLHKKYAGAIFERRSVSFPDFFTAAYTYLSSFDFSFLFVRGDEMIIHSTGRHGMFLLPVLPLFFLGLCQMMKKFSKDFVLLLSALLLTPLPLIFVGSVYRANRLINYVPLVLFFAVLGIKWIWELFNKKLRFSLLALLVGVYVYCFGSFANFYFGNYSRMISSFFTSDLDGSIKGLSELVKKTNRIPYVEKKDYINHKEAVRFLWNAYLPAREMLIWDRDEKNLPKNSLVLGITENQENQKMYGHFPGLQSDHADFYIIGP